MKLSIDYNQIAELEKIGLYLLTNDFNSLLSILPNSICFDNKWKNKAYIRTGFTDENIWFVKYVYQNPSKTEENTAYIVTADELIDAIFQMILLLKRENKLN